MRWLVLAVGLLASPAWAATYYVCDSSAEYGTEDGSSPANCFDGSGTFGVVAPGDTLMVCGNWDERLTFNEDGTAAAPVILDFRGDGGSCAPAVFNGEGFTNLQFGVYLTTVNYVTIYATGATFKNFYDSGTSDGNGVYFTGPSSHITMIGGRMSGNHFNGIFIEGCQFCVFDGQDTSNNLIKGMVLSATGAADDPTEGSIVIKNLTSGGNGRYGLQLGGGNGYFNLGGPILVDGAVLDGNLTGMQVESTRDLTVRNSTITDSTLTGVDPTGDSVTYGGFGISIDECVVCRFLNNTISGSRVREVMINDTTGVPTDITFLGNRIISTTAQTTPTGAFSNTNSASTVRLSVVSNYFRAHTTTNSAFAGLAACTACEFKNNTLIGSYNGIRFVNATPTWVVANNTIQGWTNRAISESVSSSGSTFVDNNFYNGTSNVATYGGTTYTTSTITTLDASATQADPAFTGSCSTSDNSEDCILSTTSALRNACTYASAYPLDYYGDARPAAACDVGAFEDAGGVRPTAATRPAASR